MHTIRFCSLHCINQNCRKNNPLVTAIGNRRKSPKLAHFTTADKPHNSKEKKGNYQPTRKNGGKRSYFSAKRTHPRNPTNPPDSTEFPHRFSFFSSSSPQQERTQNDSSDRKKKRKEKKRTAASDQEQREDEPKQIRRQQMRDGEAAGMDGETACSALAMRCEIARCECVCGCACVWLGLD